MIQGLGQEITEIPAFGHDITEVRAMGELVWQKSTSIPDYLCFTALEAGQFTLTIPAAVTPTYLSYVEWSKDGRTWNHTDNTSEAVTIDVQVASGDKVYWRGSGVKYAASNSSGSSFGSTANFNASGNIMSLLYADNFDGIVELPNYANIFTFLFVRCETLINAGDLLLPATRLRTSCYRGMFQGCKNLVTTPVLPALKLVAECYLSMFENCWSLVSAPALPATTIAGYCYYRMFFGCKALVTAPALSATTMYNLSYFQMFAMCSSLTTAPALPATTLANSCYAQMFYDCASLTSAPTLPATTMVYRCYYRMFEGCKFTSAPDLPATILANECYYRMFYNNINLNYVKCPATDISATDCLTNWLYGVSSTGTFIQAEGVEWPRGASGIPTGWVDVEKRTMPSGYKQLLQVTSNGTAHIQLGFGFEETDEVATTFSVDNTQGADKLIVTSERWNTNNNRYGMGQNLSGSKRVYCAPFGNRGTGATAMSGEKLNDGNLHNWTYDGNYTFAIIDLGLSNNWTATFGGITTNLRLFYGYNSNTKGAISSYKHIKGSTTACDFVAAIRESDDTAGLYDLANDVFMTCNGLTAGEEI